MLDLRRWQKNAVAVVVELLFAGKSHALIAACPGAGKTTFTITLTQEPAFIEVCDVVVIVVPSRALKGQWKKHFKGAGIIAKDEIPNEHLEKRAYADEEMFDPEAPVQIYTYAQVAANKDLFRILCARHKVLAVFDEVHHADDDEAFGEALVHAFEGAVFKLSLSGTPFNTKGGRLAFCSTERVTDDQGRDINRTLVDFSYSYGDALSASGAEGDPEVVRRVQFVRWNGLAKWQSVNVDTGVTTERIVNGSRKADPLWPLVDIEGDYARKMVDAAVARLNDIRSHHSNAGMLITVMDRDQCDAVVKYLASRGIKDVTSIMYDTPKASEAITAWEKSGQRVLVAIKMISEGVDIKRLRVGVYLSNVLTQMFFIQFVGRFIRWDGSIQTTQFACVFIPEHVTLIRYALEIERMVIEAENHIGDEGGGAGVDKPVTMRLGLVSDGSNNGIIEREEQIERDEAAGIRSALEKAGLAAQVSEGMAKALLDAYKGEFPQAAAEMKAKAPDSSASKDNDKLVTAIVQTSERIGRPYTYAHVNALVNAQVGIRSKDSLTPESKLRERLEALKRLLVQVRAGASYETAA